MLLVDYYHDVIIFSVYRKINMIMMISLGVELKLNRNRVVLQIYTAK